jgi:hypothetical protein
MSRFETIDEEKLRVMKNLQLAVEKARSVEGTIRDVLNELRLARAISGQVNGQVIDTIPPYGFHHVVVGNWWIGDRCKNDELLPAPGLEVLMSFVLPFKNELDLRVGACGALQSFEFQTEQFLLKETGANVEFRKYIL